MRRQLPVLVLAAGLAALSLAGCAGAAPDSAPGSSSTPSAPASPSNAVDPSAPCEPAASGDASDGVDVTGDVGTAPTVTVASPLSVDATQRTQLVAGTGDPLVTGGRAVVEFTLLDAKTGAIATKSSYDGSDALTLSEGTSLPGLDATLCGATVGSRVVGVIPPADAWGSTGQSSLGIGAGDTIVFVADVTDVLPPIVAEPIAEMDGMPTVTFADDGTPTITIPKTDPPAHTRLGLIEKGDGAVVPAGATVSVDYEGVAWSTGEVFDSSYARGQPASFATTQVVNGFRAALEGQTVGSTLLLVAAPVDGYGAKGSGDKIKPNETIVFVVHIESIAG
ncbi:FKBP-type peptidyl-prolyl cis-trans isomerase [Galbitalea sp. SE-J8]|uniref:FKBP-type peptidyl-prolyl cis-trans isomerase n=1 Tax=Galbitalea sp. SE-J8 TaxID=3054952 RepID=UPI00259CD744|nr:FKBP-type peptidyl-prolyl cis-trans isomerase [Galbitalea sp. SE-J8]MDM4763491.1 FKBP-type peptidyl-prolyl cis-trans isomerase [Galbitalea sp. SE-J8]